MSQTKTQLVEGLNINTSAPADALAVDNSGRVGIGTTTIPVSTKTLAYVGSGSDASWAQCGFSVSAASGSGRTHLLGLGFSGNGGTYPPAAIGAKTVNTASYEACDILFYTRSVTTDTEPSERARIDSSGRLLVGKTTASDNDGLQIQGTTDYFGAIRLSSNYPVSGIGSSHILGRINFAASDGGVAAKIEGQFDTDAGTGDYPGRLVFFTTPDGSSTPLERVRINEYGTFKASNTVIPSYKSTSLQYHELRTDNSNEWVALISHATGGNPYGINIYYQYANPASTENWFIYCNDNVATRFTVRSNGGIANYQSNNVNLCDEREKKNIVNLDSTWDCLKHWELKKFHYNEDADTDDLRYGVIAQQIAPHCPEVITEWVKQKAEDAVLDEDGNEVEFAREEIVRMAVKEQQMYWMAIKALQEAQTRIETLETANASQAATIAALDARLTALEGA